MTSKRALVGIVVAVGVALLLGAAGSAGSVRTLGVPLFALCGLVAFAIHWVIFVPSYLYRTEHFFDLTGKIAYLSVVACALVGNDHWSLRSLLLGFLITIWSLRLGLFLFGRIRRAGQDDRFDELKTRALPFLMTWTLSGLWVYLTAAAALAAMSNPQNSAVDLYAVVGTLLWLSGFLIEAVADWQKLKHRFNPDNRGKFIAHGIWAWSRHPNYFGEIVLWFGIAVIAVPALSGWQFVTLVSPLFVWLLLTRISGIPLLEAKAEARWGEDPEYCNYRDTTPVLLPWPPKQGTPDIG